MKITLPLIVIGILASTMSRKSWAAPETAKPYLKLLRETEIKNGIPKDLLVRMAHQESHFRKDIIHGPYESRAGAQGIMQIVPKWHPDVNPWNPKEAIPYAGKYVTKLYERFGNWKDAIAAYNWGPTNLSRFKKGEIKNMPTETKNYIAQISADITGV